MTEIGVQIKIKMTSSLLLIAGLCVVCGLLGLPVSAAAGEVVNSPLHITMALASPKIIVPGQPIVVRYAITNTSASASAHFDIGQNNTGWYHLSFSDKQGRPAQVIPDLRPITPPSQGLYQTGDRMLAPGDSLDGGLVITRYFQVTRPGGYRLSIHVAMDYKTEERSLSSAQGEAPLTPLHLDQTFNLAVETTLPNPAAVRATAESLCRKLIRLDVPAADQWEPVAEELFSIPDAQAFPVWQALTSDPATPDGVLVNAAHQLAYHPTRGAAILLTQMALNPARSSADSGLQPESMVAQSEITKAVSHLNGAADAPLKQYIRSLFLMNGVPASEIRFHD